MVNFPKLCETLTFNYPWQPTFNNRLHQLSLTIANNYSLWISDHCFSRNHWQQILLPFCLHELLMANLWYDRFSKIIANQTSSDRFLEIAIKQLPTTIECLCRNFDNCFFANVFHQPLTVNFHLLFFYDHCCQPLHQC